VDLPSQTTYERPRPDAPTRARIRAAADAAELRSLAYVLLLALLAAALTAAAGLAP
jgi:hypothetical protein